jgi:hypothetical protein
MKDQLYLETRVLPVGGQGSSLFIVLQAIDEKSRVLDFNLSSFPLHFLQVLAKDGVARIQSLAEISSCTA